MSNNGRDTPASVHSDNGATYRSPQGATAAASDQYEFNPETDILDTGRPTSHPSITTPYPPSFQQNMHRLPGNNQQHFFNSAMFNQPTQPAYYQQQPAHFNQFNQHIPNNNSNQHPITRQRGYGPGMARKIRELGREETITSFESWKGQLIYNLNLDPNFAPFLVAGFNWEKKGRSNPLRGLTSGQAVVNLDLLLTQIANYCPVISRSTIIKNSTSIESVWQAIRTHYGFQSSGSNFLNLCDIRFESEERPKIFFRKFNRFLNIICFQRLAISPTMVSVSLRMKSSARL